MPHMSINSSVLTSLLAEMSRSLQLSLTQIADLQSCKPISKRFQPLGFGAVCYTRIDSSRECVIISRCNCGFFSVFTCSSVDFYFFKGYTINYKPTLTTQSYSYHLVESLFIPINNYVLKSVFF